jgi:hypothetical protein
MWLGHASAGWAIAAVALLTLRSDGQSVISTHSGVVHFLQGAVYLGDQPLEFHPGKFSSVPKGGELRTGDGRAELLLTPNVFVRIGQRTAIRMVDNELAHTRVELLSGSAVVDSAGPISGTSVTLIYRNWEIGFLEQGIYRLDSDPACLWIFQGKAEIRADTGVVSVGQGMNVPLGPLLMPEQTIDPPRDALSDWAEGRQQSVAADNIIAANIQDPASLQASSPMLDSFTYFPMLGLPTVWPGLTTAYNPPGLYQPGFSSLYLPGYTFLPILIGLAPGGFAPSRLPTRPHPIIPLLPVHPYPFRPLSGYPTSVFGVHLPVSPVYSHPAAPRPVAPRPAPAHPIPPVGIHVGIHR